MYVSFRQGDKKFRIFWEVIVTTKTRKKKSNKYESGNAYFLSSVHLFIVTDEVWLSVRLRDRQGEHRKNRYFMGRVVAEGQRDALPWTNVTLSTSYKKCHGWTSGWTSPMNKYLELRKHTFPDPCLLDFFFLFWWVLQRLKIFDNFLTPIYGFWEKVHYIKQYFNNDKIRLSGAS